MAKVDPSSPRAEAGRELRARGRGRSGALVSGLGRLGLGLAASLGACDRRGAAVSRPDAEALDPAAEWEAATAADRELPALSLEGELEDFDDFPDGVPKPAKREPIPEPKVTFAGGGDLEERYRGLGWAATAAAGLLIVLEEDFKHLRAIDLGDGATRWRLKAQDAPSGRHDLYAVDGRVLLHAGGRLVIVDPAGGRRLHEVSAPFNGNDVGCRLRAEAGACAFVCECSLQVFDCATGAAVGGSYRSHENHIYFDMSEPHDTVCPVRPQLLGRAGDVAVVTVEDDRGAYAAVGLDRAGGERWRVDGVVDDGGSMFGGSTSVGMAADGSRCWIALGDRIELFDCATGGGRARVDVPDSVLASDIRWLADGGGRLWIASARKDGGAVELRAGDGRRIWAQSLGVGEHAWPLGQPLTGRYFARPSKLLLYDAARGRVAERLAIGEGTALVDDPRGGFWWVDDGVVEYDAQAKVRRRSPRELPGLLRLTQEHAVVRADPKALEVRRRDDGAAALRLDGVVSDLDLAAGPEGFVFYLHREGAAGTILAVGPRRTDAARR